MAIRYISDNSGQDIPDVDYEKLWVSITLGSQYLPEVIKFERSWDLSKTEVLALRPDAITLKNAIEAAAQAFIATVEA